MKLEEIIKCDDLIHRYRVLVGKIKSEYLRFWQTHAPHYTDHGERHCNNVKRNLEELIPEPIKRNFDEYEVFFLLSSVWLHDIGMMVRDPDEPITEVRSRHHQRCVKIIREKFSDLLNEHERTVVGEITRAHREIELSTLDEARTIQHPDLGNRRIRIRFLAALLRLADSCDICATRAKEELEGWPEEAKFYHLLHSRVSGINFRPETATLEINMLAEKDFDKEVLREFVTNKLRSELGSVQETLLNNGIYYFLKETFSKPIEPQPEIRPPPEILKEWQKRVRGETIFFITRGDLIAAFESCKKLYLLGEKVPLEIILEIARLFEERKDYQSAVEVLDFSFTLYPNNKHLLEYMGFLKHEYLFDWKGSYESFKKTFEADPKDEEAMLDLAESCIGIKKYDEAYQLATKACEITSNLVHLINGRLIQIWSLYLLGKERDGLEIIKALTTIIPSEIRKYNTWLYFSITKIIQESDLQHSVKNMLLDLIDTVNKEGKKSIEEFKSAWLKSKK